jgi:hypothetical protein
VPDTCSVLMAFYRAALAEPDQPANKLGHRREEAPNDAS